MCFGCSKEPSHRDGSFEHPQHMFWLRNKKNNFQLRTLIWGPEHIIISVGVDYMQMLLLVQHFLFENDFLMVSVIKYIGSYMSVHVLLDLLNKL